METTPAYRFLLRLVNAGRLNGFIVAKQVTLSLLYIRDASGHLHAFVFLGRLIDVYYVPREILDLKIKER